MKEIYIVEDDRDIRELLQFLLGLDYKVRAFPTVEDFQKGMSLHQPDLILLDIMLPDGNGIEICKNLRETASTTDIPVVLMSAHTRSSQIDSSCASDFISKPFDIDDLVDRIQKHLN